MKASTQIRTLNDRHNTTVRDISLNIAHENYGTSTLYFRLFSAKDHKAF